MKIKFTDTELQAAAYKSLSVTELMRNLGYKTISGGAHSNLSRRLKKSAIDTQHFKGQAINKGTINTRRLPSSDILVVNRLNGVRESPDRIRRAMLENNIKLICNVCGIPPEWNNKPLVLEVDHINSNALDNRVDNLQFICSNCHSQKTKADKRLLAPQTHNPQMPKKASRYCRQCNSRISKYGTAFCSQACFRSARKGKPGKTKIKWPSNVELLARLSSLSAEKVAKQLGVSGNAVRKRIKYINKYNKPD